jgi:hypothetical protein
VFLALPFVQRTIRALYASPPEPDDAGGLVPIAAWCGPLTGFSEVLILLFHKL